MQRSDSQTGTSSAMFRFSYRVVPVGYVPSTGSALTGSESPCIARIGPITSRTNSGAESGTSVSRMRWPAAFDGTRISCRFARALSIAWKFFWTIALPFLAYVRSVAALIASIALSLGMTPDSAKKHVCRMVLTRDPSPSPDATFDASMTWSFSFFSMICCCTTRGISSHTSSGGYGLLMSTVAPGAAAPSVSSL